MNESHRICPICKKKKNKEDYTPAAWINKRQCRECSSLYQKSKRARHRKNNESKDPYTAEEKRCPACKKMLPRTIDNFSKNANEPDGLHQYCKLCHAGRRYGMTRNDKLGLLKYQKGKCAICKDNISMNKAHIDHSHKTGKVRGLLCLNCNHGLGCFKDSFRVMERAILYLKDSPAKKFLI